MTTREDCTEECQKIWETPWEHCPHGLLTCDCGRLYDGCAQCVHDHWYILLILFSKIIISFANSCIYIHSFDHLLEFCVIIFSHHCVGLKKIMRQMTRQRSSLIPMLMKKINVYSLRIFHLHRPPLRSNCFNCTYVLKYWWAWKDAVYLSLPDWEWVLLYRL